MSSNAQIFRRALTLIAKQRTNDEPGIRMALSELSDPVLAGEVVAALVQIVTVIDKERPENLDTWIDSVLLDIAIRGDE